jgi:hypothetical protein
MESGIIAQALKDLPGTLICSSNLGWAQNILTQVIDTFIVKSQFNPFSGVGAPVGLAPVI